MNDYINNSLQNPRTSLPSSFYYYRQKGFASLIKDIFLLTDRQINRQTISILLIGKYSYGRDHPRKIVWREERVD